MKRWAGGALLLMAIAMLGIPAAEAQEQRSVIRYFVGYITPTGDFETTLPFGGRTKSVFQDGLGAGLGFEYRFNEMIGLDATVSLYNPLIRQTGSFFPPAEKRLREIPITLGPMFHFGTDTVQAYAGPMAVYMMYGKISAPDNTEFDDELTWGVKAGVDVPLGEYWAFSASVQYLAAKVEIEGTGVELDQKPIVVTLGAAYRF